MKGSEAIIKSLEQQGVKHIFGHPGGAILDVYDALYESNIEHILVRHEQCAAHAADGYARASGKIGVCMATSGPGATNLLTGIATANADSSPIVAITGQVPTSLMGADAFQESDAISLTLPITKYNMLLDNPKNIHIKLKEAFEIAFDGRQGPVHVDIPKDIQQADVKINFSESKPKINTIPEPNLNDVKNAIELLLNAERPVIYAGGGVILSNASEILTKLAEALMAPVVTSIRGKGAIPETHHLSMGMIGMHGSKFANKVISDSDCILGIGARFSDRSTYYYSSDFGERAKIIHVDVDPSEIGKNVPTDIQIITSAEKAVKMMLDVLKIQAVKPKNTVWHQRIQQIRKLNPQIKDDHNDVPIKPPRIIKELREILDEDDIVTAEVGQCEMWAAMLYPIRKPRTMIISTGMGTMGFGYPAAIGAKVAKPDKNVVDIAGDGSLLMVCQEISTAVNHDIPVVAVIINNSYLGLVRQWQELFYDKHYSGVDLGDKTDFVKLAEAFGAGGVRVEKPADIRPAIQEALASDKPYVVDVIVDKEFNVLPMVPMGGRLDDMIG